MAFLQAKERLNGMEFPTSVGKITALKQRSGLTNKQDKAS